MSMPVDPERAALESLVGRIADEFTERCRRGERPSVDEYAERHPQIAETLRLVLPAVQALYSGRNDGYGAGTDSAIRTGPMAQASQEPAHANINLPDYDIIEELGRGGMGVVCKARQISLDRMVALKMIRAGEYADESELQRFRGEALAVAQLKHPNIVQVYEIGEWQPAADSARMPYISFELVDGGSLAEKTRGEPQPPNLAAEQVEVLAKAMHAAHECGLVHRDLKPANILIAEDGTLKITDFGLAKNVAGQAAQLTQTGAVVGTPSYMAPEQAAGISKDIRPAVDIYALGAVLYELLTGRPPFKGATVLETLEQVRSIEPVPPRQLQPNCPRDLETICLKCLNKDPQKRYGDAQALAADLRAFLDGRPIDARPIGNWERLIKWIRRRPAQAGFTLMSTIAGAALIGGSAGLYYANFQALEKHKADAAAKRESNLRGEAEAAKAQADSLKEKAVLLRYATTIFLAYNEWKNNNVPRARQLLSECPEKLRHWEWRYIDRLCHSEIWATSQHATTGTRNVAFDPAGKYVVSIVTPDTRKQSMKIVFWDARTGQELKTISAGKYPIWRIALSPSGKHLATATTYRQPGRFPFVRFSQFDVWDLATDQLVCTLKGKRPGVGFGLGLAFSRDGKRLAGAWPDRTIKIWEIPLGKELFTLKGHQSHVEKLAFSDGGKLLASGDEQGKIKVWNTETGKEVLAPRGQPFRITGLAFLKEGERLLSSGMSLDAAGSPPDIRMWSMKNGGRYRYHLFHGHQAMVNDLAHSPQQNLVAAAYADGVIGVWNTKNYKSVFLRGHSDAITGLAFSADGTRLASAGKDGTLRVWDPRVDPESESHASPPGTKADLFLSPDWQRVVMREKDGAISIWSDQLRRKLHTFAKPAGVDYVLPECIGPNNRYLAGWSFELAGKKNVVRIWLIDLAAKKIVRNWIAHGDVISSMSFNPDGTKLLSASMDNTVKLWSIPSGKNQLTLTDHVGPIGWVRFHPNGKSFLAGGGVQKPSPKGEIRIWNAETGALQRVLQEPGGTLLRVIFSPNGEQIAAGQWTLSGQFPSRIFIWDTKTGKRLHALKGHWGAIMSIACSPDGKRLVVSGNDGATRIWDPHSGVHLFTFWHGMTNPYNVVGFSPDGQRLAGFVNARLRTLHIRDCARRPHASPD